MTTPVFNASGQYVSGPVPAIIINEPSAPYANATTPVDAVGRQVHPQASAPFDSDDDNEANYPELDAYKLNTSATGKRVSRKSSISTSRPWRHKRRRGGKNRTYKVRKTRIKSLKKKTKKIKKNKTKRKK